MCFVIGRINLANENMERQTTTNLNNGERVTDDRRVEVSEKGRVIEREKERLNAGENEKRMMNAREKERENGETNAGGGEKERTNANGERNARNAGEKENDGGYKKELTVIVELVGDDKVTMMELLRGIKENCGIVLACRFKARNTYEITMQEGKGKVRLMDGFKLNNTRVMAKEVRSNELVVSFLNLPPYITDDEIRKKLAVWGVKATSPIKRRKWPGTDVADGTRFCKVQFNELIQSLPYSTKFDTLEGGEHFRVIHDRQVKVCRLCIQPGHILRECPDFTCHKCKRQGHYARECSTEAERCTVCNKDSCECGQRQGGGGGSKELFDGEKEERQSRGGGGRSQELAGEEEEEQLSGGGGEGRSRDGETGAERSGDEERMEEEGVQDGEEEDETTVEETPMEAGGEKETGSSMDSALREDGGKEQRGAVERRRGEEESGVSSGLTMGQREEGSGGTREGPGVGQEGGEWIISDITDSSGDNMEEVVANRKRPLGRKDGKRQGKVKKNTKWS